MCVYKHTYSFYLIIYNLVNEGEVEERTFCKENCIKSQQCSTCSKLLKKMQWFID